MNKETKLNKLTNIPFIVCVFDRLVARVQLMKKGGKNKSVVLIIWSSVQNAGVRYSVM